MTRYFIIGIFFSLCGCVADPAILLVDLKTDLRPGQEFTTIELDFDDGLGAMSVTADPTADFLAGQRIAEVAAEMGSSFAFTVSLQREGETVVDRRVRVDVQGETGVTVVITRNCRGVVCDADGLAACVAGVCVPERCTPENPGQCGAVTTCTADVDCDASRVCLIPRCADGVCLVDTDPSMCSAEEACDADLGCATRFRGLAPVVQWSVAADGSHGERANDVDTDSLGNIYVAGEIGGDSTVDFGATGPVVVGGAAGGAIDAFVVSFDESGGYRWSQIFGGAGGRDEAREREGALAVRVDALDGVYVAGSVIGDADFGAGATTGSTNAEAFLASWTAAGTLRWARRTIGASGSRAMALDLAGPDIVRVAGYFWDDVDAGMGVMSSVGSADAFAAGYLRDDGAPLWSRTYAGGEDNRAYAVTGGLTDDLIVGGVFRGGLDLDGEVVPDRGDVNGGFLTRGAPGLLTDWAMGLGVGSTVVRGARSDGDSNLYVVGSFEGAIDLGTETLTSRGGEDGFIAAFDMSGALQWATGIGGPLADRAEAVDFIDGAIYVTGHFAQALDAGGGALITAGERDVFVSCYERDGTHRWSRAFGGVDQDEGLGIAVTDSRAVVVGRFRGSDVDFGAGPIGGDDTYHALIMQLDLRVSDGLEPPADSR